MGRIRIAIACAGLLLTTAAGARAQTTYRETGSVTIGGYLVWVRGTNASTVELFVGRGFRDAFARAHDMDAAKLQHWIDSARTIPPVAAEDTTPIDPHVHGTAVGADVELLRRMGGAHSGVRLVVSGEDPIQMAEPIARDFLVMLDSAARVSLEMSKPGPSLMVGIPAPDAPAPAAPTMVVAVATPATPATPPAAVNAAPPPPPPPPTPAPAAVVVAPAPPPPPPPSPTPVPVVVAQAPPSPPHSPMIGVPTTTTVIGVPPDSIAAPASAPAAADTATPPVLPPPSAIPAPSTPLGPSIAEAPPELVLPAPREPVILLASRGDFMPLPLPPVPIPAEKPLTPAQIAAADTSTAPADKLIRTPLGPFTVPGALLGDRDKEARYCYTQLGLKYNPDLTGEITLKLSLASDGTVQDAAVTKRSWQGISAGEVESCVRALARDWTFASSDATIVDGAKVVTFGFAPYESRASPRETLRPLRP